MDSITVNWLGPYSLNQSTPRDLQRKMGLYAVLSGSNYLFIGRAVKGKGIFRQAKINREGEYWEGLKKLGVVNGDPPAYYRLVEEVFNNCELFAGIVSRDQLGLVNEVEKILVFKLKPVCNDKYTKNLGSFEQPNVVHTGNVPIGLEQSLVGFE